MLNAKDVKHFLCGFRLYCAFLICCMNLICSRKFSLFLCEIDCLYMDLCSKESHLRIHIYARAVRAGEESPCAVP